MTWAYYNEFDPYAAAWLQNLINEGYIAPGIVDNRSILDVKPDDLRGFTQCHFFAGIGVWSYALRLAGWPDDRPAWTGSCPCQPFSVAGSGGGFGDERHLWPYWHFLIDQCRPPVVFGEQVEAAIRYGWLDLVQSDMEGIGYTFGAVGLPAAGVGAPHIRQRLWFVADRVADADGREFGGVAVFRGAECDGQDTGRPQGCGCVAPCGDYGRMADADCAGSQSREWDDKAAGHWDSPAAARGDDRHSAAGPVNGHWRAADWLYCRDGKWRPVEPGAFPLAHGAAARVGRLRAYGNAIVPQVAAEVIRAYLECRP